MLGVWEELCNGQFSGENGDVGEGGRRGEGGGGGGGRHAHSGRRNAFAVKRIDRSIDI